MSGYRQLISPFSKRFCGDDPRGGIVGASSLSSTTTFFPINSLPMDVLVLIFEYIPQYPRLRVVKFVSKRFHSAVYSSFKCLSSSDFPWNWNFVLARFTCITRLDLRKHIVDNFDLSSLLPRVSSLLLDDHKGVLCLCHYAEVSSSLTHLSLWQQSSCPDIGGLVANSLHSLTRLSLFADDAYLPSGLFLRSLSSFTCWSAYDFVVRPFIINHASQLTHLDCSSSTMMEGVSLPSLRRLSIVLTQKSDVTCFNSCPLLERLDASLSFAESVSHVTHLLPLVQAVRSIEGSISPLLPHLLLATQLTAIDSPVACSEEAVNHLLPFASRLKRLYLQGLREDATALLSCCFSIEELTLEGLCLASATRNMLPKLRSIDVTPISLLFDPNSLSILDAILLVAPQVSRVSLNMPVTSASAAVALGSFLQEAERAGVQHVQQIVSKTSRKRVLKLLNDYVQQLKWLYVEYVE